MMGPTPRIFHDNFRLSSRLTVNLGLRAEFENGVTERYNRMIGTFDPALALPIATAAQAAYAQSPVPELAAGNFVVRAGVTYPGVIGADTRRLWDVHRFHQRADRSAECCIAATRSVPHTR